MPTEEEECPAVPSRSGGGGGVAASARFSSPGAHAKAVSPPSAASMLLLLASGAVGGSEARPERAAAAAEGPIADFKARPPPLPRPRKRVMGPPLKNPGAPARARKRAARQRAYEMLTRREAGTYQVRYDTPERRVRDRRATLLSGQPARPPEGEKVRRKSRLLASSVMMTVGLTPPGRGAAAKALREAERAEAMAVARRAAALETAASAASMHSITREGPDQRRRVGRNVWVTCRSSVQGTPRVPCVLRFWFPERFGN